MKEILSQFRNGIVIITAGAIIFSCSWITKIDIVWFIGLFLVIVGLTLSISNETNTQSRIKALEEDVQSYKDYIQNNMNNNSDKIIGKEENNEKTQLP